MSNARNILEKHLVSGVLGRGKVGTDISIKVDYTLTQDATGTMAYLQFQALGIPRVKTEKSVSFVDHNTLQTSFRNADDHVYLQTVAAKHGIHFSRPGNGICHQVFLERFARPGKTLLGSDSHTPTAGGMGMIAIGAGGLDVAVAMAGEPFNLKVPRIIGIKLTGRLGKFISAKDVILEVLRRIDVKGGVGCILEYWGPGVSTLSVPERATITNMGAETGATTSIFPSDGVTRAFLEMEGRGGEWVSMPSPVDGSGFDEVIEVDLSKVEPMVAKPHSPGNVVPLSELAGMAVDQVAIGSCTNSSLKDMMAVYSILKDRSVAPGLSLGISPGSRQVLVALSKSGALAGIIASGARILESACGPCIGMGFAPPSGGKTIRTFNRNFKGRSGTQDAEIYLVSPEVAAATAVMGKLTDPRSLEGVELVPIPGRLELDDSMIIAPPVDGRGIEVKFGPNIKPVPLPDPLPEDLEIAVQLKVGDNITTDHIMPAGAAVLPLRSNIPEISKHVFKFVDPDYAARARAAGSGSVILGGSNYGQGSSREHAALAPMYLGVKVVLAKSFSRIHKANLINVGILPLELSDDDLYHVIDQGDVLQFKGIRSYVEGGANGSYVVKNITKNSTFTVENDYSSRTIDLLLAGGLLNYLKEKLKV
ncbi:MAG: aconitate hydratase [Promethearchaeota archaeon]